MKMIQLENFADMFNLSAEILIPYLHLSWSPPVAVISKTIATYESKRKQE